MSDEKTRYTNWGAITELATGLDNAEKIKSAIIDLSTERFEIEIKGNPRFTNATTGYVFNRDGELNRWKYVESMEPMGEQVQILRIRPNECQLDDETEENIFENDVTTDKVPRDENGRPTSELLSVHDVIDDIERYMKDAVAIALEAWEKWQGEDETEEEESD